MVTSARRRFPLSIRARVTWAIMLTTSLALFAAATAFTVLGFFAHKRVIIQDTEILCQAMAQSLDAALEFGNRSDAERLLRLTFGPQERVTEAWVLDERGEPFASYAREGTPGQTPPSVRLEDASRFHWPTLEVARRVRVGATGKVGGGILVRIQLGEMRDQLLLGAGVTLAFLVVILGGTFLLARAIRGRITQPIQDLQEAVGIVSADKRYSVRVPQREKDELGQLVAAFNEMLIRIQTRDRELESIREHLEDLVDLRTAELLDVNHQLSEAKERSEEASRAKSTFLASISHELRTPLNAIILYSELLRDDAERSGDRQTGEDLGKILSSGEHLLALINDVLDLAKIESGRVHAEAEEMDPGPLAWEAVHVVEPQALRSGNRIEVEIREGCPPVRADRTKLKQALVNLLGNACKFTRDGLVKLSVSSSHDAGKAWVHFQVQDSGIGIPPEQMENIFSEFMRGDAGVSRAFAGTGLGLAISRRLVRLMDGDIRVESEVGRGSTFTIHLPAGTGVGADRPLDSANPGSVRRGDTDET
ncbi:MAG: HAMP domain-containing protein [Acidobacteria bacterium]|nr:HAMP domain-containing protein [Acidobacteriota bacterium]